MAQLANNGQSLGQRLGNAYSTGLNLSLGEIQRIASRIGEKIPEPIKAGFTKISGPINNVISQLSSKLTGFANKTRMQLQNAFDISKVRTAFANAANSVDGFTQKVSGKLQGLVGIFAKTADRLPGPFGAAFGKIASSVSVLDSKFQSVGQKLAMSLGQQVLNPALQSWSSFFGTLTSKANATADKISNRFGGRVVSSVAKLSTKIGSTLSGSFSNLSSRASSALSGISQRFSGASSAGQKLAGTVRNIVSAFSLMAIAQKAINALTSSLGAAVDRVDTMNRFPKTMALLGYSAEQSKTAVDKLSKGIEGLPTTLDSAVSAAQQLTITTGNLDRGTDLALAFNNAMVGYGATTENAELALRQFNQALGAGRFQAEEFNSVAEAAPGLMNKMAEAFGKNNVPELKKALSEGEISMDQFADKMIELNGVQGGFAEMALTSAGGIRTAMGNVKNAVVRGVADMISKFDGAAKANGLKTINENLLGLKSNTLGAFDTVNAIIPNLVAAFARLKSMVNIDTSGFGAGIKAGFNLINSALGEFAKTGRLSEQTIEKIKSRLAEIGPKAIAAWALLNPRSAIATIMPLLAGLGKVGVLLGGIGAKAAVFGSVFGRAFTNLGGLVGVLAGKMTGLTGIFGTAASKGLSILGSMTGAIGSIAGMALSAIGPAAILGLVVAGLGLINNQFGSQIDQLLSIVTTKGPQIIQKLVSGITSQLPGLIASGADLIAKLAQTFAVMFPVIVQAGVDIISSLVSGVGQNAGSLISSALTVFTSFVTTIISALPQLIIIGLNFLNNLVLGIIQNIPQIQESATQIITQFTNGIQNDLPTIIAKGAEILTNLVNGAIQLLPVVISLAGTIITTLISGFVQSLPTLLGTGVTLIVTFVSGLIQNLPMIVQTAMDIVQSLIGGIVQALPQLIAAGIQLIFQLVATLIMGLPQIMEAGVKLILGLGQAMLEAIPNALSGVWEGIKTGFSSVWDSLTGKSSETTEKVSTDAQTMTANVATQTSQMSTNTNVDLTAMLNSINQNMGLANIQATNQATQMASGVNGQTGTMSSQAILDSIALANGVTSNLNTANVSATSAAQTMADGVNQAASSMNLSAVNEALGLSAGVTSNLQTAQANANSAASTMNATVTSNMASMQSNASSATSGLASNVTAGLNQASSSANASSAQMANNVTTNFNKAKSSVDNSMRSINQTVTTSFNKLNADIQAFGNKFNSAFTNSFRKASDVARNGMNTVQNAVSNGMNQALNVARNAGNQMINVMRSISGGMNSAGYYAGIGFANGLASSAGSIYAVANSIANNVVSTIRRALDIHSPSRATFALGDFTGEGMYNGMADWLGKIESMGQQYAQAVTDQKYGLESHITSTGSISSNGISSSLESLSSDILESQLSEPVFEIHNELVGDEIYTSVKEKESREYKKNEYFIYE
ncbi:TPA: tape measure protein [Streptococcus suis]